MTIQGDSLRAIQGAESSLNRHARNIASIGTSSERGSQLPAGRAFDATSSAPVAPAGPLASQGEPDLATEMVGMQIDRRTAGYNLKSLKVQDRMTGDLLDLVA